MSNTEQVESPVAPVIAVPVDRMPKRTSRWRIAAAAFALLLGGIGLGNYALIGSPVARELDSDTRNNGFSMRAHYRYYVDPTTLVLNLSDVQRAAPIDVFRGLFQSAKALQLSGRRFDRVVLARSGKPVFVMTGDSFLSLGEEFRAGQNPIFLIRTLPEKLHDPDGNPAFGRWEGGWLGVMGKQMEDVNQAARRWIGGDDVTKAGKA
jgi:hypothetical protein